MSHKEGQDSELTMYCRDVEDAPNVVEFIKAKIEKRGYKNSDEHKVIKEKTKYFVDKGKKGLGDDVTESMRIFDFNKAVYPKLKHHEDLDVIDRMSRELKSKILDGARLAVSSFEMRLLPSLPLADICHPLKTHSCRPPKPPEIVISLTTGHSSASILDIHPDGLECRHICTGA